MIKTKVFKLLLISFLFSCQSTTTHNPEEDSVYAIPDKVPAGFESIDDFHKVDTTKNLNDSIADSAATVNQ